MSKEYASPLTLEFKRSNVVLFYLSGIHTLAVIALLLSTISILLIVIVLVLLFISFVYQKSRLFQYKKVIWQQENDWVLFDSSGNETNAHLTSLSFSCSWLVILVLRDDNKKSINLLVPFDALNKESFRQLKVKITILKPEELKAITDED